MKTSALKVIALLVLVLAQNAKATFIYDNSANDQTNRLAAVDNMWFGDEVILAGTERFMTNFDFQFWTTNTLGATIDVELRLNDGTAGQFNGYDVPGTLVYSYSGFALPANTLRSTLNFDSTDLGGGVLIGGNNLTLAVRFNFNGGGGEAGVDLYNPPVTGAAYPDYWQYNGSSWELTTNNTFSVVNFGMRIEAVPEPSVFSLILLGGLALFGVRRMHARK